MSDPLGDPCAHHNFQAKVSVGRLSHADGGPITGYTADIIIHCADCGLPFRFIGLSAGTHHSEPRVSIDGTELRAPLEPAIHEKFAAHASYTMPPRSNN